MRNQKAKASRAREVLRKQYGVRKYLIRVEHFKGLTSCAACRNLVTPSDGYRTLARWTKTYHDGTEFPQLTWVHLCEDTEACRLREAVSCEPSEKS